MSQNFWISTYFSWYNILPEAVAGQNDTDGENDRDDNGDHSQCLWVSLVYTWEQQDTVLTIMQKVV